MHYFGMQLADGLILEKTASPLGVLLIIFESRPDALVQVFQLIKFLQYYISYDLARGFENYYYLSYDIHNFQYCFYSYQQFLIRPNR
jgi:hypothetical protein